jgi:hypothetical protein
VKRISGPDFCRRLNPRAKPAFLCPFENFSGSPLPEGRVDLRGSAPGYTEAGFALVGKERERLERGDLKRLTAAHICASQLVIPANHIRLRFGEPCPVAFIRMTRQLGPLAANNPGDLVLRCLAAFWASESVGSGFRCLCKKLPLFHNLPHSSPAFPNSLALRASPSNRTTPYSSLPCLKASEQDFQPPRR